MLQDVPVEIGQNLPAGTVLAVVAQPDKLKAELRIAETQARDVTVGPEGVDRHPQRTDRPAWCRASTPRCGRAR